MTRRHTWVAAIVLILGLAGAAFGQVDTPTELPTDTPTALPTSTGTHTPTQTPSPTDTLEPTHTSPPTRTPTITRTPARTSTPTRTFTITKTPTVTVTPTDTLIPTSTPTPTLTGTTTPTPGPTCFSLKNGICWVSQAMTAQTPITVADGRNPPGVTTKMCLVGLSLEGTGAASEVQLKNNGDIIYGVQAGTLNMSYAYDPPANNIVGPCITGPITIGQTSTGTARVTLGYVWVP